jgi:hypothetical protein
MTFWVIILGKHGTLLLSELELAVPFVEKAFECSIQDVPQFSHMGCGSNLNKSAHL